MSASGWLDGLPVTRDGLMCGVLTSRAWKASFSQPLWGGVRHPEKRRAVWRKAKIVSICNALLVLS